jgi:hypothetical protein
LKSALALDLGRIIQSGWIDAPKRFSRASKTTKVELRKFKYASTSYKLTTINRQLLSEQYPGEISQPVSRSIKDIAEMIAGDSEHFSINKYSPSAAVVYWFLDGIARANIRLSAGRWDVICRWAAKEFNHRRSLVVAQHDAMMDPVAMGMAACLCARLRKIGETTRLGQRKEHLTVLPSRVELERSIEELISIQTKSGIFQKYFPLFHYQDAGSNFCFTFELLEAVLHEFGESLTTPLDGRSEDPSNLLDKYDIVRGLDRAVTWCEKKRLRCLEGSTEYNGWNSGGQLETLEKGQPESWATAVVHMFLWELVEALSRHIQKRILSTYSATAPKPKWRNVKGLLDIDLWLDQKHVGLKKTLNQTIVKTFQGFTGEKAERLRRTPVEKAPLSALLFGPPGTSKTEVAKALAKELQWPLVEIDPSHFLQDGFQNIYVRAERIFEDVMDLCGVVVLFDEMDALVQKRDPKHEIGIESKFLTTYMLPKLAKLHDRGQLVFLMATNFQASFDDAIKRAGRFDFLLCMGPPTLLDKCRLIHAFFDGKSTPDTRAAGETIRKHAATDDWLWDQLSLYTYNEFSTLLGGIGSPSDVKRLKGDKLSQIVEKNTSSVYLKRDDLEALRNHPGLKNWKRIKELDAAKFDEQSLGSVTPRISSENPAVKYLLDRKQTRRQYPKLPAKM